MYHHTLHRDRKHFCCCCLQTFSTGEVLKRHVKDWFKINSKQRKYAKFKNFEIKIKSQFMIYAHFESI